MRKIIVRSNEWYDTLKEPNRTSFFLVFIMGTQIIAQYFMFVQNNPFWFMGWASIICFWRGSYIFIQLINRHKNL